MIGHWLFHIFGLDSANSPFYLFLSGIGLSALLAVVNWLRARAARSHVARQLAQAAEHHRERLQQAAEHHKAVTAQGDRHHQQVLDQADALHEALRAHISAQTPTPAATALPDRSRKTGSGM